MTGTGALETVNFKVKSKVLGGEKNLSSANEPFMWDNTPPNASKSHVLVALCIVYQCQKSTTLSQFYQDFCFIYISGS